MAMQNKLALYLKDLFEKECAYAIEKEEVEFIKAGVETIVNRIASKIQGNDTLQESRKIKFETYFKGQLKKSPTIIFGAGSFYEETKNNFPDEFDFILTLYCCEGTFEQYKRFLLEASVFDTIAGTFSQIVKELSEQNKDALFYTAPNTEPNNARKLYFDKHLSQHGPATWLRFIYEHEPNRQKVISVDFVAALQITDMNILKQVVSGSCVLEEFAKEVLSVGSCFCIGANFSFTQTEVHIMRNRLSEKHRQIYRLLKYLINGHEDVVKLESLGNFDKPYSSYMIKTVMIYHHYNCKTSDTVNFGQCILEVLDDMCKYKTTSEFPKLYKTDYRTRLRCDLCMLRSLQSLRDCLKSMKKHSGNSYNYERDKITKSVSKEYLDKSRK